MTTRSSTSARRALVVVNGDDVYEDIFTAAMELPGLLGEAGFAATVGMGTGHLTAVPRQHADLVVLYTAAGWFGTAAQRELERRVEAGTGLIAIHASNVLAADAPLADLIGSRYAGHGPRPHESRYRVNVDVGHPLVRGLQPFEITHEHYVLDLRTPAHAVAWRAAGQRHEPLVHVRQKGAGRVCYVQFGHDMRSWGEPGVREIVRRAARWTVGEAP
ncbi:ThuA domain-containing protein [Paractinoplanes globisporus]|uniref:ThuA domain-containing protein n=1 Tax=Paractinoplanes globisporus TaxID=113565 RepID=A0ABW6WFD3_9ACTN|nr:ThuA domain-containing protein [Actinoplanes globisporus]